MRQRGNIYKERERERERERGECNRKTRGEMKEEKGRRHPQNTKQDACDTCTCTRGL